MIDMARIIDFLVAGQQVVAVFGYQLVVSLLIARIARDMMGGAQVRKDAQRAQTSLVRVGPDLFRPPPAPSRAFAIDVDQLIIVVQNMIGHPSDDAANLPSLRFVCEQVIIDRIAEIMAYDL